MTDDEVGLWDRMLRCAIAAAGTVSVQPAVVVERILRWLSDNKVDRWGAPTQCLDKFLKFYLPDPHVSSK